MIDLDRAHGLVKASVSRWLRECCWCDTIAQDRGEAGVVRHLTPIEDLAACWAEWAAHRDPDVPHLGLVSVPMRALVAAEIARRATRADCAYDGERGRSVHRVNIVVRGDGAGPREAAGFTPYAGEWSDLTLKDMTAVVIDGSEAGVAEEAPTARADTGTSPVGKTEEAPTAREDAGTSPVGDGGGDEAEMAAARGC